MKPLTNFFSILAILFILFSSLTYAQNFDSFSLIAHYPLSADANDITGKNLPMELINTPFQDGGIYCNGNYIDGDQDSCNATTPDVSDFNFSSFAISLTFKISQSYDERKPIIVGGSSWRWMSIFIDPDSSIGFDMFGAFLNSPSSQTKYNPNSWHKVSVIYDSVSQTGELFLDDILIQIDATQLNHGNENFFTITHSGAGRTFKGILKDLKIYSKSQSTDIAELTQNKTNHFDLVQTYPNPFNASTLIKFSIKKPGNVLLKLFDLKGEEVKTLTNDFYGTGNHQILLNSNNFASGIYFISIKTENFYLTRKITLIK